MSSPPSSKRSFDISAAPTIGSRRAPQLPPYRTHQESDLAHHRDRMPRLPCRGTGAENGVFRRPCTQSDEGVNAARIGFEHCLGVVVEQREIAPRGARGVELPGQHIAGKRRFSDPLRVAPGTPAQQCFHLPEPIHAWAKPSPAKASRCEAARTCGIPQVSRRRSTFPDNSGTVAALLKSGQ
jgi:hypothetical protein